MRAEVAQLSGHRSGHQLGGRSSSCLRVEADGAVAAPVLFLFVLLAVQFALWQHGQQIVEAAAQEGVAAARVENGSQAAGSARADQVLAQLGRSVLSGTEVHVLRTATSARVEVSGSVISVLPWPRRTVRGLAEAPVESVTPTAAR